MNASEYQLPPSQLIRKSLPTVMTWLTPAVLAVGYLLGQALGLSAGDSLWGVTRILPPVFLVGGPLLSWSCITFLMRRQLQGGPGAQEEAHFKRLLQLPWMLAIAGVGVPWLFLGLVYSCVLIFVFDRSVLLIGLGLLIAIASGVAFSVPVALLLERLLMPSLLTEQQRLGRRPEGNGPFWPRQSWLLPSLLATVLATTLPLGPLVATLQVSRLNDAQVRALREGASLSREQAERVVAQLGGFHDTLVWQVSHALLVVGAFSLLIPSLVAWLMARRQARAGAALQESLEALTSGTSKPPRWASSDEAGDMSAALLALQRRLEQVPLTLRSAAEQLGNMGATLSSAGNEHRESMLQQAGALQEVQVTSQEVRQTSTMASRRVEDVLQVVVRAEKLGENGEAALAKTRAGLSTIREFAEGIHARVKQVQASASQIGDIALSVKDLASQSNILSINAAIEAARAGNEGSGFAVVAQEFRRLTVQSLQETVRISRIVEEVGSSIQELVSMSEQGAQQVEGGLALVNASGESLRELSGMIRESASAARMIAMAVNQQDSGISQIFTAISQLNSGMNDAIQRMETVMEATQTLESTTQQVQEAAQRYQLHHG